MAFGDHLPGSPVQRHGVRQSPVAIEDEPAGWHIGHIRFSIIHFLALLGHLSTSIKTSTPQVFLPNRGPLTARLPDPNGPPSPWADYRASARSDGRLPGFAGNCKCGYARYARPCRPELSAARHTLRFLPPPSAPATEI